MKKNRQYYEKVGRMVIDLGESGAIDRRKLYRTAFIKGIFGGLGGVVGATILVSILVWLFTLIGDVPLLGRIIELVEKSLPN